MMYTIRYSLPLEVVLNRPIKKDGYETACLPMNELNFRDISSADIGNLGGQYDWIDACLDRDYDRRMKGFNNKDVLMEVVYDKGYYIITLVSDKPFDTIVRNNRYSSSEGPWDEITLQEAIERFFEGCIYDGVGENPIGNIYYDYEKLEVWMGTDLVQIE